MMRLRLQRSVLERGLRLAVKRRLRGYGAMCHGLGSGVPEQREAGRRYEPTEKKGVIVGGGQEEEQWD